MWVADAGNDIWGNWEGQMVSFLKKNYLFWLLWVSVVAHGIFVQAWGGLLSFHGGTNFPTRNQTQAPALKGWWPDPLDHQGSPLKPF